MMYFIDFSLNTEPELEKAGAMGLAETFFFRFSAKSFLFSAKLLLNYLNFI